MEWSPEELVGSWTLVEEDWRLIGNKTGATRLGFAALLKFFEIEAAFPSAVSEVPLGAVDYLAEQVRVDPTAFASYPWTGRTIEYHRAQVREAFGFREFARADEDTLTEWLAGQVCPFEQRDEQLRDALLVRCRDLRVEPPGRPNRIIGAARAAFETEFCEQTVARLDPECVARLEALIAIDEPDALLAELKADPGRVGLETLLREIDKLAAVQVIGLPADLFTDASEKLVAAWRARAARSYPSDLRAMTPPVRVTLPAAAPRRSPTPWSTW